MTAKVIPFPLRRTNRTEVSTPSKLALRVLREVVKAGVEYEVEHTSAGDLLVATTNPYTHKELHLVVSRSGLVFYKTNDNYLCNGVVAGLLTTEQGSEPTLEQLIAWVRN